MNKTGLVIGMLLLLSCALVRAQNPFIKLYTTADGLPSDEVNVICEDNQKFIWIATDGGLVKYDGAEFVRYSTSDGLGRNQVMAIKTDSRQRLWFFCAGAQPNFQFQGKIYNSKDSPFLDSLKGTWNFAEDEDGKLYFYSYHSRKIRCLDTNNHVKFYILPSHPLEAFPWSTDGMDIQSLQRKSSGDFVIWTYMGIYQTDDLNKEPTQITPFDGGYHNIFEVSDTIIYDVIQTENPEKSKMVRYVNESPVDTILFEAAVIDNDCCIKEDPDGRLWVSSPVKGVYCIQDHKVIFHMDSQQIYWLSFDHEGNTWASSQQGAFRISPYALMFRHYDLTHFQNRKIDALTADPEGRVWGLYNNILFRYSGNDFFVRDLDDLHRNFIDLEGLENNSLVLTTNNTDYYAVTDIITEAASRTVRFGDIFMLYKPGGRGTIGINRERDEVCHFDRYDDLVTTYSVKDGFKRMVQDTIDPATDVFYNANDEIVVVGMKESYILGNRSRIPGPEYDDLPRNIPVAHQILDHSSDVFLSMFDSLYLVNPNGVYNLSESFNYTVNTPFNRLTYGDSVLYAATFRNIFKFNKPWEIKGEHTGELSFIDINFQDIRDILVSKDSLYIASSEGLTIIPVDMLGKIINRVPVPYFRSIAIDDSLVDGQSEGISIRGKAKLSIEFGSIDYTANPVSFSYMMEGYDASWSQGTGTSVVYAGLRPGNYTFRLKAAKTNSQWSAPVEYHILVKATFWQHPLFIIGLSILVTLLVSLLVIYRKNVQIRNIETEHQLVTLEQKALQSMMNPHFLFNALGSMQHYLLQNKPAEAGLYLSQFARLIRQNIHSVNSPMISLEEEMDRLKNYLDLEKMRMKNRFDYRFDIEEGIEDDAVLIPSMIIQPFVENSILHGISPMENGGLIVISFKMISDRSIEVVIEDNGVGMTQSRAFKTGSPGHLHLSMEMTRKRIEILGRKYHVETSIAVSEAFPGNPAPGTHVKLVLPVSYVKSKD